MQPNPRTQFVQQKMQAISQAVQQATAQLNSDQDVQLYMQLIEHSVQYTMNFATQGVGVSFFPAKQLSTQTSTSTTPQWPNWQGNSNSNSAPNFGQALQGGFGLRKNGGK